MYFAHFYLDQEKDIIVDLYMQNDQLTYCLRTPNHATGNLITNLAHMCNVPISFDENGLKVMRGEIPCYYNDEGNLVYIFHLLDTKIANIYPDGRIERRASIPAISKTLMSQTKNYSLSFMKSVVKTFILRENKFHTDLHTHMNANLKPDILIALGIRHQIRYPLYYIKKLDLKCSQQQWDMLNTQRQHVSQEYANCGLQGKYLDRRIDDHTFINFADLLLNNISNAAWNIAKIRASLSVMKDGQAVFTNLEKVYLYRYVFTKGVESTDKIQFKHIEQIPDVDIQNALWKMLEDERSEAYHKNTLFQNKLLWIARQYQRTGITYAEISDTTLVKQKEAIKMLEQVHDIMPKVYAETGVMLRFLAAFRRIPLTIIRDKIPVNNYEENLKALYGVMLDPYVAGSDIVGEEINDIRQLRPLIKELTHIASFDPSFVIRIHAGENDSLLDNVYYSIRCVEESLSYAQTMPKMRIGHGLYTANLSSEKGKRLMAYIREKNVILEFQITSNVRLNNLSDLSHHPLKQYLNHGISCVQGTDGGALYGTDSIDEQLTLQKVLRLTDADMQKMCVVERSVIQQAKDSFQKKTQYLQTLLKEKTMEEVYQERMVSFTPSTSFMQETDVCGSIDLFHNQIEEMPSNKMPIIIAGGSFNNDTHVTKVLKEYKKLIDDLLKKCDPRKTVFVIGNALKGYERYLIQQNHGQFDIYAFVPSVMKESEASALRKAGVHIRVAIETSNMGIYKSVSYEVFKRRPSVLLALDGNSSAVNLIQEAKNAKYPCRIFVNQHASMLKKKADSLHGYVTEMKDSNILSDVLKYIQ